MTAGPTITVTVKSIGGEPFLDAQCMSLLFGVSVADVSALPTVGGASAIPREWVRRARRRAREAQAHKGSGALLDVLGYWAHQEHGAEVTVVYE